MKVFKTKHSNRETIISTAALPDIIFMLLFFFMVTTVLREDNILVRQQIPKATQLRKLERKKLVSYLYIGKPMDEKFGTEPKIQANDKFIEAESVIQFVEQEKEKLDENEKEALTISLKVDEETKMGIVVDVTQKLRDVNARKLMYAAGKRAEDQ